MPLSSERTIGRLSLYRRVLNELVTRGTTNIFSHQLATMVNGTAAQVRRDVMAIGYSGSPTRGYDVPELVDSINNLLDAPNGLKVALVGAGNLGRALMAYFSGRRPKLSIAAAFDKDPNKVNRVINGCNCYPLEKLDTILRDNDIRVAIITVPAPEAKAVADQLIAAGIRGILNFAPVPLNAPANVFVEGVDVTMSLEKVAYFARQKT